MSARELSLKHLRDIHHGKRSSLVIDQSLSNQAQLSPEDKRLSTELTYGVLRWQGTLDQIIGRFSHKGIKKLSPLVLDILRIGAYQLLFLERIPEFAAINESVTLVKKSKESWARGLVNAILRSIQREKADLSVILRAKPEESPDFVKQLAFHTSHEPWMVQSWVDTYGRDKALEICKANNAVPNICLRVNPLKITRDDYIKKLKEALPTRQSPVGIYLSKGANVRELPFYEDGYFQVQDEASQMVGYACKPASGDRILDACAAPGGKTTHLAELMKDSGEIIALDVKENRLSQVKKNAKRLGLKSIQTKALDFLKFKDDKKFDLILIDAPCSGMGVIRRRPEAKWNRDASKVKNLAEVQTKMIEHATSLLKPNGVIIYSVCTFTTEETEDVINTFLKAHPEFKLDPIDKLLPNGTLLSLPSPSMDGFFIARIVCHSEGE